MDRLNERKSIGEENVIIRHNQLQVFYYLLYRPTTYDWTFTNILSSSSPTLCLVFVDPADTTGFHLPLQLYSFYTFDSVKNQRPKRWFVYICDGLMGKRNDINFSLLPKKRGKNSTDFVDTESSLRFWKKLLVTGAVVAGFRLSVAMLFEKRVYNNSRAAGRWNRFWLSSFFASLWSGGTPASAEWAHIHNPHMFSRTKTKPRSPSVSNTLDSWIFMCFAWKGLVGYSHRIHFSFNVLKPPPQWRINASLFPLESIQ